MLGDINVKVGKKTFSNQQLEMRVYTKLNNDNGVRVANFVSSKNLAAKSTMFTHPNLLILLGCPLNENTHNEIENIFDK
jgi:hypothetical protein